MGSPRLAIVLLVLGATGLGACSMNRENTDVASRGDTGTTPVTTSNRAGGGDGTARSSPSTVPTAPPTTARKRQRNDRPRRTTTTTTTLLPARRAHNPRCVVQIRSGDSLFAIAQAADRPAVNITSLQRENRITDPDRIDAGDLLDICVRNGVNDINGRKRTPPRRGPPATSASGQ